MKYLCVNCNYIYDEAIWDSWEGIEAGTKIDLWRIWYISSCKWRDNISLKWFKW